VAAHLQERLARDLAVAAAVVVVAAEHLQLQQVLSFELPMGNRILPGIGHRQRRPTSTTDVAGF
jgi:hypothetical protein